MTTCPKCRSPVEVPGDHTEAAIRCGICWAMVPLPPREKPVTAAMLLDEEAPPVMITGDPFAAIPGRPAKGMAPLEALLQKIAVRQPALLLAVSLPEPVEEPQSVPVPRLRENVHRDDGEIRRKRGVVTNVVTEEPVRRSSSLAFLVILATVAFIGLAYLLAKRLLR